jgi:glycosyltransferase involved in cell wall biosynthesis
VTLVSVVVAVKNASRTLQKCLDSVSAQSHMERELLVIDGGSSDGSMGIIQRNAASISYWCSEPDNGIYDAWNKALARANGEWVCFLGADDAFASPRAIARLIEAGAGADAVTGRVAIVDGSDTVRRVVGRPWDWQEMRSHQVVAHPGSIHRAALFARFGGFDPSLKIVGDYDFFLRLGPTAQVHFLDEIVVRMMRGGVSRRAVLPVLKESWRVQSRHSAIWPLRASWNFVSAFAKSVGRRLVGRE